MVVSGILYGIFQRYQFSARRHLPASEIQLLYTPTGIVGYVLAIFWLGESLTVVRLVGYLLILIATILVLNRNGKFKLNRYIWLVFTTGACLSIAATIDRHVSPNFSSAITYGSIIWFFECLVCFLPFIKLSKIKKEFINQKYSLLPIALINFLALLFLISALRLAPATQVMPIANSNVVFIGIAGIVILKERDRIPIKLLATLITFVGLFLVSR